MRLVGWLALAAALGCYSWYQIYLPLKRLHSNDFKHMYLGAKIMRQGHSPYDAERMLYEAREHRFPTILPYVYPPFTGLVLMPLSYLPFWKAFHVWYFLSHVLMIAAICLIVRSVYGRWSPAASALWIFYAALFFPLTRNLTTGQLNVALLFCYALIWHLHEKNKPAAVGLVTAFGALFKISPALLFLYFLWKRQWRNLLWSCAFAALFLLISIAFVGWQTHLEFIPLARQMSYGHSTWEEYGHDFYRQPFNQSFNSFFHHIMTKNPHTNPLLKLPKPYADKMTMLISLILLGIVLCHARSKGQGNPTDYWEQRDYALFIMLSLLLPSLCWDHYFVQMFFPMIVIGYGAARRGWRLMLPFLVAALYIMAMPFNFDSDAFRMEPGILMMSLKLWAALAIFILLLLSVKRPPKTEADAP